MKERNSYVYVLKEPKKNKIFYVGKGTNHRDKAHFKPHLWKSPKDTTNPFLYHKIASIFNSGDRPIVERVEENLTDEEAYELEAEIIAEYGRRFVDGGELFNLSDFKGGFYTGQSHPWTDERRKRHQEFSRAKRKYDPSAEELYDDYIVKNKKREQIAQENGVSIVLVKKRLAEHGIYKPANKRYPEQNNYECLICGKKFMTAKSVKRKFCSRACYGKDKKKKNDDRD